MTYRGPILTVAAIAIFVGLIAYAVVRGSADGGTKTPSTFRPTGSVAATGVEFVSPLDGDTVTNPVDVALAVGGLRLQKASEPVTPGFGHLGVIIDGAIPAEGEQFVTDATHLDLTDASHNATLPNLIPGPHTLSVIFMNAKSVSNGPLLAQTIHITVSAAP